MTVLDHDPTACGGRRPDPSAEPSTGPAAADSDPAAPEEPLRVVGWPDAVIDRLGHDPRSWYVEQFWLPVLGPTSTWLMRRIAAGLDMAEDGFSLERDDTARALGLGGRQGRHSPFARALTRCVTFEVARWQGPHVLAVRRKLPPLPRRHVLRLTPRLQRLHEAWTTVQGRLPSFEEHRRRARRLAVGLLELGDGPDVIESQLMRWGVHPALAHDAATWVLALPQAARIGA